jgi:hypothetical protein
MYQKIELINGNNYLVFLVLLLLLKTSENKESIYVMTMNT